MLGIVLGYLGGAVFGGLGEDGWRLVYQSVAPLEILMLLGAISVPESPRWLALRNRREDAINSLVSIQPALSTVEATNAVDEMIKASLQTTKEDVQDTKEIKETEGIVEKVTDLLGSPYNRKALTIGVGYV